MNQAGGGKTRKIAAYRRGWLAEYRAAVFLLFKGYRIAAIRYRTKAGEIDIIARKADLAIFIEVKARATAEAAIASVAHESRRRIEAASLIWLSRQKDAAKLSRRYDVVAVMPFKMPLHLKDVF